MQSSRLFSSVVSYQQYHNISERVALNRGILHFLLYSHQLAPTSPPYTSTTASTGLRRQRVAGCHSHFFVKMTGTTPKRRRADREVRELLLDVTNTTPARATAPKRQ